MGDEKPLPKQFVFVADNGTFVESFKDLKKTGRAIVLDEKVSGVGNPFLKPIRKVHISFLANSIISLPFKQIWGYTLDSVPWNKETQYYVLFVNPFPYDVSYLDKLRDKYHIKYILFASFPVGYSGRFFEWQRKTAEKLGYDYIFTFDFADAEKYGFLYHDVPYSVVDGDKPYEIEYDCYFAGGMGTRHLDRVFLCHRICELAMENGADVRFRISGVPKNKQKYKDRFIYNERVPYAKVVEESRASNCILDILGDGQTGASLRYYEAVCYNRKLLTNNKDIINMPFYNPEYIQIFETPEDIDWNWVKERIPVDYHYDGRFSPTRLIDRILELEEEKEG